MLDVDGARARCSRPTPSSCTWPPRPGCGPRSPIRWGTPAPTSPAPPRCSRRPGGRACPASCSARPPRSTATARRRRSGRTPSAVEPVSPYAATKRAGELLLQLGRADLRLPERASLRFFTVYGPRQRPDLAIHAFTRRMVEGEPITLFGDGTQARDYTYCDDIVAGVLAAIDWTATAPVGHGARSTSAATGRCRPATWWRRSPRRWASSPSIEWGPMQPGDVQQTAADLTKSGRGARLRAEDAVPRGHSAVRRLVPGGLWPGRLSACWRGRATGSRSRTTTARSTCSRRSSPRAGPSPTCTTCIGVSLSLLGRSEEALTQFAPALELNPALPRGADPPGPGAERAGPGAARRRSRSAAPPRAWRRRRPGCRRRWPRGWPTSTPSWPTPTPRPAPWPGRSSSTSAPSSSGPGFQDLRYRMARRDARGGPAARGARGAGGGAPRAAQLRRRARPRSAWRTSCPATASGRARSGGPASRAGPRMRGSRPTSRCWDARARETRRAARAGWRRCWPRRCGCGGSADRERLGDRAYGEGRYAEALAEYRALPPGQARRRASGPRLGAAALHAGELRESAGCLPAACRRRPDPGATEAAEGLEAWPARPSVPATRDVLREVVTGLQAIAPGARHRALRAHPGAAARCRTPPSWWRCCPARSRPRRRRRRSIRC